MKRLCLVAVICIFSLQTACAQSPSRPYGITDSYLRGDTGNPSKPTATPTPTPEPTPTPTLTPTPEPTPTDQAKITLQCAELGQLIAQPCPSGWKKLEFGTPATDEDPHFDTVVGYVSNKDPIFGIPLPFGIKAGGGPSQRGTEEDPLSAERGGVLMVCFPFLADFSVWCPFDELF